MTPFRLQITGTCCATLDAVKENAAANADYPRLQGSKPHGRRLAVCGGGPLLANDLDELRAWDGDVWAINHTAKWLNDRGVRATLISVDPEYFDTEAPAALLATACHPDVVKKFADRVQVFDIVETHAFGIAGGQFTVTRAPSIALHMGYTDVSIFGCEGSFLATDHVDRDEGRPHQLIVRAGGVDYRTCPPFLMQCEELMKLFLFDGFLHNRSHGLLEAMIENPETWEVVAVSEAFKAHLEEMNGACGMYDQPYQPASAA